MFRSIPSKIATLDELAVPTGLRKLVEVRSGLVLVTGPTGSGKTTTLAAMIVRAHQLRVGDAALDRIAHRERHLNDAGAQELPR